MRKALLSISVFLLSLSAFSQQKEEGEIVYLSADQLFEKAAEYMEDEKWQLAKDIYTGILNSSPDNLRALYFRAYANERMYHFGLARADYDAILQKEPENYHALSGRAVLNQKDSHFTDALDDANLLVEQYPDSTTAWVIRANIEEQLGYLPLAEYDYQQAYLLNPKKREYVLHAIELQIQQKKKKEAKRNLDKLVKAGIPKNSLLYYYKKINKRNP